MPGNNNRLALGQGDIAVNLFAILLVIFVLMDLSEQQTTIDGFPVNALKEPEQETPLAVVPGWRPVQPIRAKFYVFDGQVYRFDADQLAAAFAGQSDKPDLPPGAVDRSRLLPKDADPTAYRIEIYHTGMALPDAVTRYSFPLEALETGALPESLTADLSTLPAVEIFVPRAQVDDAFPLATLLTDARIPFSLRATRTEGRFGFERSSSRQGFEEALK